MAIARDMTSEEVLLVDLVMIVRRLEEAKPDDRSEKSRRYAITITELEKAIAYYETMVIRDALSRYDY